MSLNIDEAADASSFSPPVSKGNEKQPNKLPQPPKLALRVRRHLLLEYIVQSRSTKRDNIWLNDLEAARAFRNADGQTVEMPPSRLTIGQNGFLTCLHLSTHRPKPSRDLETPLIRLFSCDVR